VTWRTGVPEKKLRFKVKLEGEQGSTATWMNAPFDVQETFGTKGRVPVRGTMNGFPFRSALMPMGGCHGMAVNRALPEGAKAQAGDLVDVVLQRDSEERTVEVLKELAKEPARNKQAHKRWQKLSFTHQKEMALSITAAKQDETKQRRLLKVIHVLNHGRSGPGDGSRQWPVISISDL